MSFSQKKKKRRLTLLSILFEFYRNATIKTAMSAGDTPDILDA